ncbi:aminoglycoside phosphotransferase family protein [Streptomyces europaeiscabiei]|uniref:aminoglycoside phosphotransferase family protein n=1 Tax=Streptomyces europaeiscabiei TaxID=146819 RepID=UPI0029A0DD87|nr:aminoglycoside phosphotransferase family protein [Streptomyces europaeiscabiei]MDX2762644.1 aminoglycoside phosphotransferase family protein [Streptomyces europaeiscabiei]MDX3783098.1 aminoglycoside phosphotransferase family protein [Streptomyces europaeiscabiei]MDX3861201.1 aminoglycoside phosphotransferase family protein [Streptomyces europaeiscabiei]MDX3868624.1 aminoglycoside phosphotransferase family protein [Streptomyces europaeiscabiei]
MPAESDSTGRRRAGEMSADPGEVEGPLSGYHHETYVFRLPPEAGVGGSARWKCRDPRESLLWFDRRCFDSEERLLTELQGRIGNIPDLIEVEGTVLQRFVEGDTLGALHASDTAVPEKEFEQILALFRQLVAVTPRTLLVKRRCERRDRARENDSAGFLDRLICFTEERVYGDNLPEYGELFAALKLDFDSFKQLRKHVAGLRERPFCLLHADLHRENLIVDRERRLWAIDWELAMFGDPLYDLATHLHLMRYPLEQERRVTERWCALVEDVREGSSRGWREDLPKLLDYKKAQSVFTDVIRTSQSLRLEPKVDRSLLRTATWTVWDVLSRGARPLGVERLPSVSVIEAALVRWLRKRGGGSRSRRQDRVGP